MKCGVCNSNLIEILKLNSGQCVTSLGAVLKTNALVYSCSKCGHCQTKINISLDKYYNSSYKSLSNSSEEDDLYEIKNNVPIYRNEHMARIFLSKIFYFINDNVNINLLDYGCGKSLFCKNILQYSDRLNIHLYDVSNDYKKYWTDFFPLAPSATFYTPNGWNSKFDVVSSAFSLEHVENPKEILFHIRSLLKDDGVLYLVIPNMYSENISDILVVDHIHHYSTESISHLLTECGFHLRQEDKLSHRQASVYIAQKYKKNDLEKKYLINFDRLKCTLDRQTKIADYYSKYIISLRNFMISCDGSCSVFIVGAGVMGSLVFSVISEMSLVVGFIDSNIFKQTKGWMSKPVYPPHHIPESSINNPIYIMALNSHLIDLIGPSLLPPNVDMKSVWFPPNTILV